VFIEIYVHLDKCQNTFQENYIVCVSVSFVFYTVPKLEDVCY